MISYRDYLISKAASVASSLTDAIDMALQMDSEVFAVDVLEQKIEVARVLLRGSPNPERVAPRPYEEGGDDIDPHPGPGV